MNQLGRALTEYTDPPVKALFVYNSNAAVTVAAPDQGPARASSARISSRVVFEQMLTDTARYADVLLPATTFLEGYDLVRGYGPISAAPRPAGDRAGRRIAVERRRVRRAADAPRPGGRRRPERRARGDARRDRRSLPEPAGDAGAGVGRRHVRLRRPADPVRGRVPAHAGPEGRPVPRGARPRARRPDSTAISRTRPRRSSR